MTPAPSITYDHPSRPGGALTRRYRALTPWAPLSLVLALLSILTLFHWLLGLLPAAGIVTGLIALKQIQKAPEEVTGRPVALSGVWISAIAWALSTGWLVFASFKEVPFGYERINYEMLQPDPKKREAIPAAIFEYQGKKVFVEGYMSPGRQQTGLRGFILCPAIADCPFCTPNPKPTEMIRISLEGDLTTDYTTGLVRIGGRLEIDTAPLDGIPYRIDADYIR